MPNGSRQFPPALIYLLFDTETGASGASLQNRITNDLPDGAQAFVNGTSSYWRLDRTSSAAPSADVIAPIAGPGRWLRVEGGGECDPQVGIIWVNAATTAELADQNGTECAPFATFQQAADYIVANGSGTTVDWLVIGAGGVYPEGGTLTISSDIPQTYRLNGALLSCDISYEPSTLGRLRIFDGACDGTFTVNQETRIVFDGFSVQDIAFGVNASGFFTFKNGSNVPGIATLTGYEVTVYNSSIGTLEALSVNATGDTDLTTALDDLVLQGTIDAIGCYVGIMNVGSFRLHDCTISNDITVTSDDHSYFMDCEWDSNALEINGPLNHVFHMDGWTYGQFYRRAIVLAGGATVETWGAPHPVIPHGNLGATPSIDFSKSTNHSGTVNASATFTFSAPPVVGDTVNLLLTINNVGAFTLTWPASVIWVGGTPTPAGANLKIRATGIWDGTNYWLAWIPDYKV
jgi:hypothetical protein